MNSIQIINKIAMETKARTGRLPSIEDSFKQYIKVKNFKTT